MRTLIKNGHVIDPASGLDAKRDVLIKGDRIEGIYQPGKYSPGLREKVIDAKGLYVFPGLVDMHTHLREPGYEHKELISTGTMAALRGGFTTVCAMPNTNPLNDNTGITEFMIHRAMTEGNCTVYPIGCITKGQKSEELTDMNLMTRAGCVAFSDDGRPVTNSIIMRRALEYSISCGAVVISHAEELELSGNGVMNEGLTALTHGLAGIPRASEEIAIARDIILAELTGGRLHIAHVSSGGSVRLIRDAKKRGVRVTAETCPHYFTLTDESCRGFNTMAKVNPPLRGPEDVKLIKEGLKDGTIDAIATDHAPHSTGEKAREFDTAPFGISGLETALALSLGLVREGVLGLNDMVSKLASVPSSILGLQKGALKPGSDADIAIADPEKKWTVRGAEFLSKGGNTPFEGMELKGRAVLTIHKGKVHTWG